MGVDLEVFEGTKQDKEIAKTSFRLMAAQGALFATDAPIKQTLSNLAEYFARIHEGKTLEEVSKLVDRALSRNPEIFLREETDGTVVYITSKRGRYVPQPAGEQDVTHRLKSRFYEPRPEELIQRPPKAAPAPVEPTPAELEEEAVETREAPLPVVEEAEAPSEVEVPVEEAVPPVLVVAPGVSIDLSMDTEEILEKYGDYFRNALRRAMSEDFRFVTFGKEYYLEELVARFSKGDLRRIKEYIIESNEPLPDTALLSDALGKRPGEPDYPAMKFSLNYRLLREKKDFEFVGVADEHLWSVSELPPIGVQRKKASEIGQELRHLSQQGLMDQPFETELLKEENGVGQLIHHLTYWDYENGLLPYDRTAMEFFPKPFVEEQRAIILHLESPQNFVVYLGEIRLPSSNRGGWIAGLEGFMEENLIPGATITFSSTDRQDYFLVDFTKVPAQQGNLLQFDEKKQRFVFRPVTYYCKADPRMLLSESRFPKLNGRKRLEESERRRAESVIAWAFEITGEKVTQDGEEVYLALLDDLLPVVNIEKPFSSGYLERLLSGKPYSQFRPDPATEGAYYYRPGKS